MNYLFVLLPVLWILNYLSYYAVDIYLQISYEKYFNYDDKRKNYILKNFIKTYVLKYITVWTIPLVPLVPLNIYDMTSIIQLVGCIYTCGDTIALFKVKLSKSTKIHHTITSSVNILNLFISYKNPHPVQNLLMIYTILSCYSYDVNYCLGMRFLVSKDEEKIMKVKARNVYSLLCFINWSIHLIYLILNLKNIDILVILYYLMMSLIVYDDIILLKWLTVKQ